VWLRAYQDSVYGVFLASRGDRVGRHTSMSDRLKEGKPTAVHLAEHLPDYEAWFREWRDRRNEMKIGASFRTVMDGDPPRLRGLSFEYPRTDSVDGIPFFGPPSMRVLVGCWFCSGVRIGRVSCS
jgi:hypothetical protein